MLRLMCMEGCDTLDDQALLHETKKGRKSEWLLQALGDEPTDDGGAQVVRPHQATRVSTLSAEDP